MSLRKDSPREATIVQGDIFRDVTFVEDVFERPAGILHVPRIVFPHIVILTQACDLEHGSLLSVLAAPLYNAIHVFSGEHLTEIVVSPTKPIDRKGTQGRTITQNREPRYHHLQFPEGVVVPESIIDFRHYFSVNAAYLRSIRRTHLAWTVPALWRDDISRRFAAFLARIGLPQQMPPPDPAKVDDALRWPPKT